MWKAYFLLGINMSSFPESFTSIKSKMNKNVRFAVEQMNKSLEALCGDPQVSDKDKMKASQDFLAMYMRLENEIMKESEHKEVMKHRKLTTKIKQAEVAEIEGDDGEKSLKPINQSKFSSTMS